MAGGKELRYRILLYLKQQERSAGHIPNLDEVASELHIPSDEVFDQLEILQAQGAIDAHFTMGGGASPMLRGAGKLLLEELADEYDISDVGPGSLSPAKDVSATAANYEWDAFIAHASEDKDGFVRPLAEALRQHVRVWYDEFTLRVGDSLRKRIEDGLANSRFGIVVLSPNFFAKKWPQDELDGLDVRERGGEKVILPVWLNIDQAGVAKYSPIIAGRYAAKEADGLPRVVNDLLHAMGVEDTAPAAARAPKQDHTRRTVGPGIGGTTLPQTELEIDIVGATRAPPDMRLVVKASHVYGPPVVPVSFRVWSVLITGEAPEGALPAYLQPGRDIGCTVPLRRQPRNTDPTASSVDTGWPLNEAPNDIWVFFQFRTLDGTVLEVARTFELERPPNQNIFSYGAATSHMRRR